MPSPSQSQSGSSSPITLSSQAVIHAMLRRWLNGFDRLFIVLYGCFARTKQPHGFMSTLIKFIFKLSRMAAGGLNVNRGGRGLRISDSSRLELQRWAACGWRGLFRRCGLRCDRAWCCGLASILSVLFRSHRSEIGLQRAQPVWHISGSRQALREVLDCEQLDEKHGCARMVGPASHSGRVSLQTIHNVLDGCSQD